MTIEIHRPELEALILGRMKAGGFQTVEDALMEALEASQVADGKRAISVNNRTGADLIAAMQSSPYREIEIEPCPVSTAGARLSLLMAWLLDTNILSELRRLKPEPKVWCLLPTVLFTSLTSAL